ncbi:GNAT family N-acetyltransferase [Sutcliffiella halmapala]|uniref:GNAT family N-acetyltransferase n=1 Tax=Sutcliffiella halmapala TaxID=79882 RepID=UPI0009949E7F|nr:GNAT family N-acetyltransferase [Sutcliffiella halmapala]
MNETIHFSLEPPDDFTQLLSIYEVLGWNSLNLTVNELEQMCKQSWYTIYAFNDAKLIGMGRIISDGVITGVICGVCVLPSFQSKGIGKEMLHRMVDHCENNRVIPQLLCAENLEAYYESIGFEKFSIGMTKKIKR